jgi:probable HAF family extracellular repeat protein
MKDIGTLGGEFGYANAINDRGEVVGDSTTLEGPYQASAFHWTEKGGMKDLGPLDDATIGDGSTGVSALGINQRGEVVGVSGVPTGEEHAVSWLPVILRLQ